MIRLSVNVNKIATLRNARGGDIPNVVEAARTCIAAGCHGITVHPRPDARHITFQDVFDLAAMMTVEFNIEGYPGAEFIDLVMRVRPTQVTLVPDPPGVLTSSAGWNLTSGEADWLSDLLGKFRDAGIRTSLFLDADAKQIRVRAKARHRSNRAVHRSVCARIRHACRKGSSRIASRSSRSRAKTRTRRECRARSRSQEHSHLRKSGQRFAGSVDRARADQSTRSTWA